MKADYDSEGDTLEIELEEIDHLDFGDDSIPGTIVHRVDGRPVLIDVLSAREHFGERLRAVADAYQFDGEALVAAGHAAISAPDREVTLDFAARHAA